MDIWQRRERRARDARWYVQYVSCVVFDGKVWIAPAPAPAQVEAVEDCCFIVVFGSFQPTYRTYRYSYMQYFNGTDSPLLRGKQTLRYLSPTSLI